MIRRSSFALTASSVLTKWLGAKPVPKAIADGDISKGPALLFPLRPVIVIQTLSEGPLVWPIDPDGWRMA